ncbi:I78 family peptidase inhibitor [uncultured Brevundimonas sp.]|uniref:I78 family peptidase inhibitor n=1 Tax=uncultured Brevundimonas sp. TaxID=213418 RepID=UPI0030EB7AC1|tara:strand:+ start:7723 stop:8001 length:279 start_codon:yes stop_codon:yes gene_type:complete
MKTAAVCLGVSTVILVSGCAPVLPGDGPGPQRCDAAASQSLIGRHVGAVTFPRDANVRVVCTTCVTTMDYNPDRLNVRFDQATGIIEKVDCG